MIDNRRAVLGVSAMLFLLFSGLSLAEGKVEISSRFVNSVPADNIGFATAEISEYSEDTVALYLATSAALNCLNNIQLCGPTYWDNVVQGNLQACQLLSIESHVTEEEFLGWLVPQITGLASTDSRVEDLFQQAVAVCVDWIQTTPFAAIQADETDGWTIPGLVFYLGAVTGNTLQQMNQNRSLRQQTGLALAISMVLRAYRDAKNDNEAMWIGHMGRVAATEDDIPRIQNAITSAITKCCNDTDVLYEEVGERFFVPQWNEIACINSESDQWKLDHPQETMFASAASLKVYQQTNAFRKLTKNPDYLEVINGAAMSQCTN